MDRARCSTPPRAFARTTNRERRIDELEFSVHDERRTTPVPTWSTAEDGCACGRADALDARLLPSALFRLQALLAAQGGPASVPYDSDKVPVRGRAWRELLAGLSRLDPILGLIAFQTAIDGRETEFAGRSSCFDPRRPWCRVSR